MRWFCWLGWVVGDHRIGVVSGVLASDPKRLICLFGGIFSSVRFGVLDSVENGWARALRQFVNR